MPPANNKPVTKRRLSFSYKWLCLLLLAVIVAMLAVWHPWNTGISDRTVDVTGQATVKAEPDEYVFSPTYTPANRAALTKKSDEVVTGLKKLGVADDQITTSANQDAYYPQGSKTYLYITVTVDDKKLAQKVQNYLLTTSPKGEITPQYTFSKAKQAQLEAEAKNQAEQDARAKAEQSAKNLGFKIGKVKSLNDNGGFGIGPCGFEGLCRGAAMDLKATSASSPELTLHPGQNELPYSVQITYYIR